MSLVTVPKEWVIEFKKPVNVWGCKDFPLSALTTKLVLANTPVLKEEIKSPDSNATPVHNIKFPAIVDVKVGKERLSKEEKKNISEKNRKNVYTIVKFDDGTVEKATTSKDDEYNLEQGIQICLAKKAFSLINGNGSNTFNNLVNSAIKLYNDKEKEKTKTKEVVENSKPNVETIADKIKRQRAKERENRINEMAEACARAMRMVNEGNNNG